MLKELSKMIKQGPDCKECPLNIKLKLLEKNPCGYHNCFITKKKTTPKDGPKNLE